ncbi:MAG: sodium:solute symporter family transporter [Planctomycetota bacterium]
MDAILVGFVVYLVVVLAVGVVTARRSRTQADYLIGGRRISSWVIALSERASGESAWLLLGLPGAVLAAGLLEIWTVVGCLAGYVLAFAAVIVVTLLTSKPEKANATADERR